MTYVVPQVPTLPAGYIVTADDMNDLSEVCTFLMTKPLCRAYDSVGTQAIGTSLTTISWGAVSLDVYPSGAAAMWSSGTPTRLTIQVQGFYKVRYLVKAYGVATMNTEAYVTTGANNPGGSGNLYSHWLGYDYAAAADPGGCAGASGIWPMRLYPGDYMTIAVSTDTAGHTDASTPSQFSLEWVSN